MPLRPTALFLVRELIIQPIPAEPGQYLALWVLDDEYSLTVIAADRATTVRRSDLPHGPAISQLLHLSIDHAISMLSMEDALGLLRIALTHYADHRRHETSSPEDSPEALPLRAAPFGSRPRRHPER